MSFANCYGTAVIRYSVQEELEERQEVKWHPVSCKHHRYSVNMMSANVRKSADIAEYHQS